MKSILLVEDDEELAELLKNHLKKFDILHVSNAKEALETISLNNTLSLIILDLSLPDIDGLEFCKLVSSKSDLNIIISSARSSISDKLEGLNYKCVYDYIVKPYDPRELESRILKILSHKETLNTNSVFSINYDKSEVSKNGQVITFTKAEYEIFKLLFLNQNHYFSRVDIANNMQAHSLDSMLDSISMLISKIRKKIDTKGSEDSYIINRRGIGYSFYEKI